MSIIVNDNIKVSAPKPSDPRYLNSSNVAYTSVSQANSTIPVTERHEGLQLKVGTDIYWYKNGTADSDLVLFSVGSTGSTITASNGLVKVGNDIRLGGALTGSTTLSGGAFNYNASGNRHVILNLNTETGGPDNNGGIQLKVLDGSNGTTLSMDDFGFVLSNNVSGFPGAKYGADYSTHYTDRSLVDKGFVLGLVSGSSLTANNGLTKSGNNIYLGGLLTGDTIISGSTNNTITIATSTGNTNTTLTITPLDLTINNYIDGELRTNFDIGQDQVQFYAGQSGMYIQSQGAAVFYSSSGASINMDVGDIFITADQYNTSASLDFKTSGITFSFLAPVVGGLSISDSVSPAGRANASGRASFAMGSAAFAKGLHSFAGGQGTTSGNKQILATGSTSFNFSTNDSSQTSGHGALASSSAILGGLNHNIPKTALRSGVIGGNAIKVGASVLDTIHFPKVRLGLGTGGALTTFVSGASYNLMNRNSSTGELQIVPSSVILAATPYKQAVKYATTVNLTGGTYFNSGGTFNGDPLGVINFSPSIVGRTIDGIVVSLNDRLLLKDQTTGLQNGIYNVSSSSSLTRDLSFYRNVNKGDTVFVQSGTTNGNAMWVLKTDSPTIGSTALSFAPVGLIKNSSTNGHITLTGGTAVVSTKAVAASSVIIVCVDGGTQTNVGGVRVSARSAGSNFTITSLNPLDTSQVAWFVI